jgi:uncharacterized protein (DUF1501 family)
MRSLGDFPVADQAVSRRDFLAAGAVAAGAATLALPQLYADSAVRYRPLNSIVLFVVGGPSHLETWDPKPGAPESIRGPFRPIATNVSGIAISENFPLLAQRMNRCALVRSVYHKAPAIHETGQQLLQTGQLARPGIEFPHHGAVLAQLDARSSERPANVLLPGPIANTGVSVSHGQGGGFLGTPAAPFTPTVAAQRAELGHESARLRDRYGRHRFGQNCLLARRQIEQGTRCVTVNMFDTVFNEITWDCHADGGSLATTFDDYRTTLCPMFDQAYTALLDDLTDRGMLRDTLVVAMGEFGRTPIINPRGGRDHWPHVWSVLFAGGPVVGGQVIGSSDKHGTEPRDRPIQAAQIAATIYQALGVDTHVRLTGPQGESLPLVEVDPVWEVVG